MRQYWLVVPVAIFTASLSNAADYTPLTSKARLEAGDSWTQDGARYRLYGIQSCLRGTSFTDRAGQKRDCGEASIAVLAAFIKDIRPQCAPVTIIETTRFVLCYGTVGSQRVDLATALIMEGYAFAALDADGLPVHAPYAVAEQQARARKAGLWQFSDVQHPALLLSKAVKTRAAQ
ncbi:endonuclease YncB(thermonuclease family) [Rhizobium sp. SLBN-94]|nr:endonuclease YncB(thermonuclease family) [Rhizobium sp. SLBN-94]